MHAHATTNWPIVYCSTIDHKWNQMNQKGRKKQTNPSQNKCVFSSENFFYHQTKRIKYDLCVLFFFTKWTFFSLRTPFFVCRMSYRKWPRWSRLTAKWFVCQTTRPNNSVVVNNKKKFFGEYFQEDEREKTGGLTTYPGQSLCEVYPAKKKKKKKKIY